ncbi:hypothetical protein J4377_13475 [Halomonas sp. XH26]|uniref:DUF4376 domain-containing protein n=1 Tax=Halomonas sp. XH26 TaxID=2557993 RepID=UPI00209FDE4E|nr:hypothetical protein [Halomonas sp. XH26]UTA78963.1 hypothetical protein J4377_13475 [Halomonas sp. XH26]
MSWLADAEVTTIEMRDAAQKASLKEVIESQRKTAEAEGVVINDVRYSGDPANRQALLEVVQFAREASIESFESWKDSDDQFHANHPLVDVEQALQAIAHRRGTLIALEAQYQSQVDDGTLTDVSELTW